jgi:hypothetical protein
MPMYKGKEVRVTCKGPKTCNLIYVDTDAVELGVPHSELVDKQAEAEKPAPSFMTKKEKKSYFNQKD